MATNSFQARALYDFVGESSQELSFNAGEILFIDSTTAGQQWWRAQNSAGQVGDIPATYVERIYDNTQEPIQEPPAPANTYDDMNFGIMNINSYIQPLPQTNVEPIMGEQSQLYSNLDTNFNWPSAEPTSVQTDQANHSNERGISFQSSFDSSLSSLATNQNTFNATPDQYITVIDPSPSIESVPATLINPFSMQNTASNQQQDLWYADYSGSSQVVTTTTTNPPPSSNVLSPFGYTQSMPSQQQNYDTSFMFPPTTSLDENLYEIPKPFIPSTFTNQSTTIQSAPFIPPSPSDNLMSPVSPVIPTPSKLNTENSLVSPSPKPKSEKSNFFTLRRQKTKPEAVSHSNKEEFDSDLESSGSLKPNTTLNRQSTPGADTKAATRPRLFDKHGIDNYILHGSKAKVDERVDIGYDEKSGYVYWLPNAKTPPFSCKIEDPAKGSKLGGLKSFTEYKIHAQISNGRVVSRRYKQFEWLHEQLVNKFRFICVPPLPGKQIAGRFENEFIEERRRQLELWLNRICHHPVLCASFPVQHFVTCELTEKNNKDWKAGKRKSEKDELREAAWLHCVTHTQSNLTEAQIATQIDAFAQQQPGLETHLKNLNQGLIKYLERHAEIYKPDMQRLGELFSKVFIALQTDASTIGNQELSLSVSKISASFQGIAELYKTKGSESVRNFNERIQEYIGLLACFPLILNIQRSASECIKSVQQRGPTATPDFSGAIHRGQVFNYVVLAEINFFQKDKVNDLNLYLKSLLHEQIQFYENITVELRAAAATFD
ncbi:unnamed protein product [Adineta steineri]|uniref:Sorting nexin n=1 Tax=Adineta steineri TaxID=433720 RepID=A0A814RKD1_9BILA|nr:unnamed protein product [Adineta steineri]